MTRHSSTSGKVAAPAAVAQLPASCLLISYDLEAEGSGPANKPTEWVIPHAASGLGAVAFRWPERTLLPLPLAEVTFHRSIFPRVARNEIGTKFWAENPEAEAVIRSNPVTVGVAAASFQAWVASMQCACDRPVALVAGPHSFDGAHIVDVMSTIDGGAEWLLRTATLHDVKGTIANHLGIAAKAAQERYKKCLATVQKGFVLHLDDHDSLIQGLAMFAALEPDAK